MKIKIFTLLFLFIFSFFFSQKTETDSIVRKKIAAVKITNSPKIDGILDEEVWQNAPVAENFIERSPNNGKPEAENFKTTVKFLYDDTGIYIGAQLNDPNSEKIDKELMERDNIGNDDLFGIVINGYNDKQQSLEFIVSPTNVQYDAKITTDNGEDSSWNGIWYSAVKITEKGWFVEMKIPYSEIRFPKKNIQEWGLNIVRRVQREKTMYDWNFVDNKKNSYLLFDGMLQGIENINTPTRLSFLPYFSTYINNYEGKTSSSFNGGMDVKYGINDAFTLDTTLIPDFGQANFDATVLNLGPFEQQFQEQRSFFTEGTELFSKGNLFYSRRVGGYPSRYPEVSDNESILENPEKVKLINATKVSGRTNKGLGIGFFNGISEKTEAKIINNITGKIRSETTEPLANYNVMVFDQRFRGNSSVSFVNTNVTRSGDFRDANATALMFDINNKKNTYNYFGGVKGSWVMENGTEFGNEIYTGFGKTSGKNRYSLGFDAITKNFNIDDLGYTGGTNYYDFNGNYSYRYLQPKNNINNLNINVNTNYRRRLDTDLFNQWNINATLNITNKKFQSYGIGLFVTPLGENDIYEPRTFGRYLKNPTTIDPWIWFNSDTRKKFMYSATIDNYFYTQNGRMNSRFFLNTRYRFSDHFSMKWNASLSLYKNDVGFAGNDETAIFLGRRNTKSIENYITSQYTFNDKMMINFSFRHYFSEVDYKNFYTLNQNGTLAENSTFNNRSDITFNTWNIDLRYSWWFAPGSQLTLLYRNAISNFLPNSGLNFNKNFDNLFNEPMANNISLKMTYYIDYNSAKHWFK